VLSPIVDSNIERIFKRLFADSFVGEKPDNRLMLEIAQRLLPDTQHALFNYGLLDVGALICRYTQPFCTVCPINAFCDTGFRNLAQSLKKVTE
jgi:A/G-specific adenine glycosylase